MFCLSLNNQGGYTAPPILNIISIPQTNPSFCLASVPSIIESALNMDPIMNLAREKDLWVVEDCAQANGATYKGRQVGSIGDVAAFSFCQDKIITTDGEGGMVTMSLSNRKP